MLYSKYDDWVYVLGNWLERAGFYCFIVPQIFSQESKLIADDENIN